MAKIELPIDIGFYESDSLPHAAQSCINLYPFNAETKGPLSQGGLMRTPGMAQTDTLGSGPGRGFYKDRKTNKLYAVSGNSLYSKTNIATNTSLGTIEGSGRVSMAFNGVTLCIIVPGGKGYFYTISSGLVEITDVIFTDFQAQQGGVTSVCLKDNRFIYTTDEEFFIGSVATTNNGQNFDALDFEDAEVQSDPIVRCMTIKNELYIFGSETIELYQNVGGSSFPYTRIPGATIDRGIKSRFGIIEFDDSFLFLGNGTTEQPSIWKGASGAALKISTSAIDTVIQSYTDAELSTVTTWAYTENGGFFVGFTFPNETFVYDATASANQQRPIWHERKTGSTAWRVEDIVTIFGETLVSDSGDAKIGILSRTYLDEYGTAIERTFSGAVLAQGGASFNISSVELKSKAGFGNTKGTTGDDPMIEMLVSTNGAATFESKGLRSLGRDGNYNTRQIWRRIGRIAYDITFKFTTSAPISIDFYRVDVEVK